MLSSRRLTSASEAIQRGKARLEPFLRGIEDYVREVVGQVGYLATVVARREPAVFHFQSGWAAVHLGAKARPASGPLEEPFAILHLHGVLLRMRGAMGHLAAAWNKLMFSLEERTGNIWLLKPP